MGQRHYDVNNNKLPSVTTILSQTQSKEKQESIAKWKAKVGENEATRVKDQAASRGTNMHLHLERYILGRGHKDLTDEGQVAGDMAQTIIDKGLCDVSEVWGSEVTLYYPDLYAGQTDLVGVYDYENSIIDFKQSNKPKRKEWIDDYFMQLGAYAMAHNHVYNTEITQGVILMCTPDNYFQKFQIKGREFIKYQHKFLERLDKYYSDRIVANKAEKP
jgi:genome maintenance exonuclease 1|tara:strand:- start:92 stop:742 length:651 start_codon:yes stop_codon:yes gene_type:complete